MSPVTSSILCLFLAMRSACGLDRPHWRSDRGQATTEYALVLLAAALVGVLVIGWATAGGGAAAVGRLFDTVIESAIEQL